MLAKLNAFIAAEKSVERGRKTEISESKDPAARAKSPPPASGARAKSPPPAADDSRMGTTVYLAPPLEGYAEPDFGNEARNALTADEKAEVARSEAAPASRLPPALAPPAGRTAPVIAPSALPPPPVPSQTLRGLSAPTLLPSLPASSSAEFVHPTRSEPSQTLYCPIPPLTNGPDAPLSPKSAYPPPPLSRADSSPATTTNRSGTVVYSTPPVEEEAASSNRSGTVMYTEPPDLTGEETKQSLSSLMEALTAPPESAAPASAPAAPSVSAPKERPTMPVRRDSQAAAIAEQLPAGIREQMVQFQMALRAEMQEDLQTMQDVRSILLAPLSLLP